MKLKFEDFQNMHMTGMLKQFESPCPKCKKNDLGKNKDIMIPAKKGQKNKHD